MSVMEEERARVASYMSSPERTTHQRKMRAQGILRGSKGGPFTEMGWIKDRAFGCMKEGGQTRIASILVDSDNKIVSHCCNCDDQQGWMCVHCLCLSWVAFEVS